MKKLLNILGYISILIIPYLILIVCLKCSITVKIISLIVALILIIMQIANYFKNKKKNFGIRILITIISIIISIFIIHNIYSILKTIEGKKFLNNIEKIETEDSIVEEDDLKKGKISFINGASMLSKGYINGIIYYKDGSIENTRVFYLFPSSSAFIIELNGNEYSIDLPDDF